MFDALSLTPYSDVPIDLIAPDENPGGLPGPGEDTNTPLGFHDYDFSAVHTYSDLEYTELRASVGVNFGLTDAIGLFGAFTYYDLQDDEPYLQDATGSVEIVSGGLTWSF